MFLPLWLCHLGKSAWPTTLTTEGSHSGITEQLQQPQALWIRACPSPKFRRHSSRTRAVMPCPMGVWTRRNRPSTTFGAQAPTRSANYNDPRSPGSDDLCCDPANRTNEESYGSGIVIAFRPPIPQTPVAMLLECCDVSALRHGMHGSPLLSITPAIFLRCQRICVSQTLSHRINRPITEKPTVTADGPVKSHLVGRSKA